ncbi:MAG: hypothetical protein A3E80_06555 [Chlamydiae bacterium RIFCSPHIGHO2_12_FULL_49_9]|nr:MAG: hypothetical protein A3E80_06555 [Chlamydiae bacterium RIFCSPHIGHO2_12_FULL_49_9]
MKKSIRNSAIVLARFFLSAIFLTAAVNKILNWQETERMLMNVFSDWQSYAWFSESTQEFFGFITPWTALILIVAILLELVGGFLVLLGIKEELGAGLLILFLIPVTIVMHPFWFFDTAARELQTIMFLKNLAILGGLILVCLNGAKAKSSSDPFASMRIS